MATIKDIARAAGVSQGTVSNVLNGRDIVSSEKIERVMKAVDEMGYTINEKAQILRKGSAKALAAVVPNLYDRPYVDFFTSFKRYAEQHGYLVDLYTTDDDVECERKIISRLRSRMTDGIAVYSSITDSSMAYYDAGFSKDEVVFVSRQQSYDSRFIGFDYTLAGTEMAQAAAKKNYSNIALLMGAPRQSSKRTFRDAFIITLQALAPNCKVHECVTNSSCRYKNAVRVFTHNPAPQAVFAENIALAEVAQNVHDDFFPKQTLDIYTVSPTSILPENNFIKYEMDCRLLGKSAAKLLIEKNGKSDETVLAPKGFTKWHTGSVASTGKTLSIATMGSPTTRALQSIINLYEEATGTKIRLVELSNNAFYNIMKSWGEATPYDIVRLDVDWLRLFAKDVFEPLDNIDHDIKSEMTGYLPNVMHKYANVGDQLYAFPGTPSVQLLFYRKDLFENVQIKRLYYEEFKEQLAPPKNYAEYNKIASFFTKSINPASPTLYGTTLVTGDADVAGTEFLMRYFSHTRTLIGASGVSDLSTSKAARLALSELIEASKCASGAPHSWWTDGVQEFARGNTAMTVQFINHISDLVGPDSLVSDKIGWAAAPGGNPMLGGSVMSISKYSPLKSDALDFLKWINSDDIATANTLLGGMSPKTATYENCEVTDNYPWLPFARDHFAQSHIHYCTAKRKEPLEIRYVQSLIGLAVTEALGGRLSQEQALHFAEESLNAAIN